MSEDKPKQYKFDPFKFIANRQSSVPLTEDDFLNFSNFMPCAILSMNKNYSKFVEHLNTIPFGRLSKRHQCLAYTSFDGASMPYREYLKVAKKKVSEEVEKISILLDVSLKSAKYMVDYKTIDIDKALNLYQQVYEPETLITKTGKVKK